jgi:hypothetical protein
MTQYEYDAKGNLVGLTDQGGKRCTIECQAPSAVMTALLDRSPPVRVRQRVPLTCSSSLFR